MSTTWKGVATKNAPAQLPGRREGVPVAGNDLAMAVVPASLRAIETLYVSAMLEEARLFEVLERLVSMFAEGMLPIRPGPAEKILYSRWKAGPGRLTVSQRRTVYARVFGIADTSSKVAPNPEFDDLWLRFVATAGMYAAELQSLPASERSVTADELRGSGLDLAVHLSFQGHGLASLAAPDLKKDLDEILELLADSEIRNVFGAVDRWQVLDRIWSSEPGRKPNVKRSRTRAESGQIIIRWLANHRNLLARSTGRIFKEEQIRQGRIAATPEKQRTYPTDYDLIRACEQWLAVTGTEEE